jgi:hypothetical protein
MEGLASFSIEFEKPAEKRLLSRRKLHRLSFLHDLFRGFPKKTKKLIKSVTLFLLFVKGSTGRNDAANAGSEARQHTMKRRLIVVRGTI